MEDKWTCPTCNGLGWYRQESKETSNGVVMTECKYCGGTGVQPSALQAFIENLQKKFDSIVWPNHDNMT